MSVITEDSVFTSLQQHGPLAVEDTIDLSRPFSRKTKEWVRNLCVQRINTTKYRALRSQVFEFLGITDFSQLSELLKNPRHQEERSHRACALLGNMFGLNGTVREIEARVYEYARTADAVVNSLSGKMLKPYASSIATTNEIEVANDPVTLILIMFNNRYHKKARFEARRKLVLMNLAGSIDQRERETEIEQKFSNFLHFLNDYVWSTNLKIGEHDIVYLHSQHTEDDFRCTDVKTVTAGQAMEIQAQPGQQTHPAETTALHRRQPGYPHLRVDPQEAARSQGPETVAQE